MKKLLLVIILCGLSSTSWAEEEGSIVLSLKEEPASQKETLVESLLVRLKADRVAGEFDSEDDYYREYLHILTTHFGETNGRKKYDEMRTAESEGGQESQPDQASAGPSLKASTHPNNESRVVDIWYPVGYIGLKEPSGLKNHR